ncbi:hypothetical protein VTL71DRAFT_13480 [Oculimacula yallundae]|uniref:Uncharacterized protein n=1 Tax=Oculimacula yallundae TaxID=86028 RepID=A0ABR4CL16_9HELO
MYFDVSYTNNDSGIYLFHARNQPIKQLASKSCHPSIPPCPPFHTTNLTNAKSQSYKFQENVKQTDPLFLPLPLKTIRNQR